jgi:hypothetical protein
MKKLIPFIAFLALLTVSCRERTAPLRDTIPYVKQLAEDSTAFSLVRAYRSQGTRGSIAVVGEPEAALLLSEAFLQADVRDNIDGKPGNDRLPDFAGESFDVIMDAYNAPYRRMAESSPDSLREVAVRCAMMSLDTVSYAHALDPQSRLSKKKAKVFVLASSMLTEFGQFDIDTLVKMASREPLILNPVDAMMDAVRGASLAHVAAWVPAPAKPAYEAAATGLDCAVISPVGGSDVRSAFRDLLRQYRSLKPNTALDAVLVDSFTMDLEELHAEVEHIHRQITEEDMAFDRLLAPKFHFIEPKSSLTEACYRLLREKNLFTHDIAYPAVRYYQTEEGMDGDFVLVEIGSEYLANLRSGILETPDKAPDYVYVPDND